jgi:tyrosyl-tRNA synthetase
MAHGPMSPEDQLALLSRGAVEILPDAATLLERLRLCAREGRPLRVKQGFDPTAPDIHLGHTVGLRKLRQFQDLGHQVVLIVGDYTGMVGDPSGRNKTRPQLTAHEVETHAHTYLEQFFRVLDPQPAPPRLPVEIHRNGEWFSRMDFMGVMRLAGQYTVARILERDDFAKRMREQQPISLHELFYPIMQGYDSVEIRADVELGATEQKFNLLVGRVLQETHGQPPQIALTLPVLPGLDGVQRMSKSLGNYVGVSDAPADMFGKLMSLPDRVMADYWTLVTDADAEKLAAVERQLALAMNPEGSTPEESKQAGGVLNPMVIKKDLARTLVRMYHGEAAATAAQNDFEAQFSRRETPEHLEEFGPAELAKALGHASGAGIVEVLVASGIAASKSAARRLVEQRAVSVDGERVSGLEHPIDTSRSFILRAGRQMRRFRADSPS